MQWGFILKQHLTEFLTWFWVRIPDLQYHLLRGHRQGPYQTEGINIQVYFLSFNTTDFHVSEHEKFSTQIYSSKPHRINQLWRDLWKAFSPMPALKEILPSWDCSGPPQLRSDLEGFEFPASVCFPLDEKSSALHSPMLQLPEFSVSNLVVISQ